MSVLREHGTQSVLTVLQATVVVAGSMCTATILKALGYPESHDMWPSLSVFVRNWGFLFLIIPASWAITTLWLERHQSSWFSKRWTLITGIIVLAALSFLFVVSTTQPASGILIRMGDP